MTYTGVLYAEPSVLEGVGRLIDLGGFLRDYNYSLTPEQADALAALADTRAVQGDIAAALRELAALIEAQLQEADPVAQP